MFAPVLTDGGTLKATVHNESRVGGFFVPMNIDPLPEDPSLPNDSDRERDERIEDEYQEALLEREISQ